MKPYSLFPDVQFLFFTAEGQRFLSTPSAERERTLSDLESLLNKKNPIVIAHQTSEHNSTLDFLQFYAKQMLNTNRQNKKVAYKKFIQDLFIPELELFLEISTWLSKLPAYQTSDVLLENMRESLKSTSFSIMHDEDADRYGYALVFKILTTVGLLYLQLGINWELGVTYNVMAMVKEMIDCTDWTPYPKMNAAIQIGLRELLPCALVVGIHVATIPGALNEVVSYAALSFSLTRASQFICNSFNKLSGESSPFYQYFQNYFVYAGMTYLFKQYNPLSGLGVKTDLVNANDLSTFNNEGKYFIIDDPQKCLHDQQAQAAAASYLNIPISSTLQQLRKHFRDLSKLAYETGYPKDNAATVAQNLAFECLRMGKK